MSKEIFEEILKDGSVETEFKAHGLNEEHIALIKQLISGAKDENESQDENQFVKEKIKEKPFLFEVNNLFKYTSV